MKIAMCCNIPLIPTLMFHKAEYFCSKCKRTYGLFGTPDSTEETDEILQELDSLREWFANAVSGYIPFGAMKPECDLCKSEPHHIHMTEAEAKESDAALKRVLEEQPPKAA